MRKTSRIWHSRFISKAVPYPLARPSPCTCEIPYPGKSVHAFALASFPVSPVGGCFFMGKDSMSTQRFNAGLLEFLQASPTLFLATKTIAQHLTAAGFDDLRGG